MRPMGYLLIAALTLMVGVMPVLAEQSESGKATQNECMTVPEIMPKNQPAAPGANNLNSGSYRLLQGTQSSPCPDSAVAMLGR